MSNCMSNQDCPMGCSCVNGECTPVKTQYQKVDTNWSLHFIFYSKDMSKFSVHTLREGQFVEEYFDGKKTRLVRLKEGKVLVTQLIHQAVYSRNVFDVTELDLCRSEDPVLVDMGYELILDKIKNL